MKLDKSFFKISPESFNAINVRPSTRESFVVVDLEMSIAAEHNTITASNSMSINNKSALYSLDTQIKDGPSAYVIEDLSLDYFLSVQCLEYRNLFFSTSLAFSFTSSTKVSIVSLDLSGQEHLSMSGMASDSVSYHIEGFENCWVRGLICLEDFLTETSGLESLVSQSQSPAEIFSLDIQRPVKSENLCLQRMRWYL